MSVQIIQKEPCQSGRWIDGQVSMVYLSVGKLLHYWNIITQLYLNANIHPDAIFMQGYYTCLAGHPLPRLS